MMPIITPLETNARTLITTKYRRALPPRWERVGTKPPARLQLLREDPCVTLHGRSICKKCFTEARRENGRYGVGCPCVIKDSAFRAKYADIFEKQTPMLSWTWRIYGIQYDKVDIRTNKPLNAHFRFRLSCSVSIQD